MVHDQVWHFPLIKEAARLTKQFIMTQRAHKVPVSSKHLFWAIVVKPFSLATNIYQNPEDKHNSMRYFLKRGCAAIDYKELYATLPDPDPSSSKLSTAAVSSTSSGGKQQQK